MSGGRKTFRRESCVVCSLCLVLVEKGKKNYILCGKIVI